MCSGVREIGDLRLCGGEACTRWLTSEVVATPLLHRVSRQYRRAGVVAEHPLGNCAPWQRKTVRKIASLLCVGPRPLLLGRALPIIGCGDIGGRFMMMLGVTPYATIGTGNDGA